MSISGPRLLDDDFAADVYNEFLERYRAGEKPAGILKTLETEFAHDRTIEGHEDVFWFAIGLVQWECGVLLPAVKKRVEEAVKSDRDPMRWEVDDAVQAKARRRVLKDLVKKLQTPNRRPKVAKPARGVAPIFRRGDCLAVRLPDFDWTAALVTDRPEDLLPPAERTSGTTVIALLKWKSHIKPDLKVFERREWFVLTHHNHEFAEPRPVLIPLSRDGAIAERYLVEVIGSVPILESDPKDAEGVTGSWRSALDEVILQERWERGIREDVPMNFAQFKDPGIRDLMKSSFPRGLRYECTPKQRATGKI